MEFLKKYIKRYSLKIIVMVILTILVAIFTLLTPIIFSFIVDDVLANITEGSSLLDIASQNKSLISGALLVITVNLMLALFYYLRGKNNAQLGEHVVCDIRNDLYHHIQLLPYDFFVKSDSGELIQKCTNDVDMIGRIFSNQLSEMVYCIMIAGLAMAYLFYLNWKLALLAFITIPIIFIFAIVFFSKMQKRFLASDNADGRLVSKLQEAINGVRVVKAFNNEKYEIAQFDKYNQEYRDITFDMIKLLGLYYSVSDFLVYSQIVLVVIFGIFAVLNKDITIGDLLVFITYETNILYPIRQLGRIIADIGKVSVSSKRLKGIMDVMIEDQESGIDHEIKDEILFENVSFDYGNGIEVLHDINFKIKQGSTIAIMGTTGSGKSSLVHLLTRLYDCTSGRIMIDGIDITNINRLNLRKQIGIVLQEPYLYSKTIYENIKTDDITENDVYESCKLACVHDVILNFKDGYQTLVGEKGVTLSGGQKQRLAIARTLARKFKIVIFDDSLSAVDTKTDKDIQNKLKTLRDLTKIIICQRVNSAANADMIIMLDKGTICEMGTHDELIKANGLYAKVYALQNKMVGGEADVRLSREGI